MENGSKGKSLIDSVPVSPPRNTNSTIEESILNKKKPLNLPRESSPIQATRRTQRPKTAFATNSIFSNMNTPYDISHRRSHLKRKKIKQQELSKDEEPTFVNLNPPKGKFWVAPQRKDAQDLKIELTELELQAQEEAKNAESEFEATTLELERNIQAHQKILDEFTDKADGDAPERGKLLHRIADYYRDIAHEIPSIKANFATKYENVTSELKQVEDQKKKLEQDRDASLNAVERQNRTIEGLKQQIKDFQTRCTNAETQLREVQNDKIAMSRSSQTNQLKLVEIGRQIQEKKEQQNKLNQLIDTLSKDIQMRTMELQGATSDLNEIETTLDKLRREITSYKQISEDRTALREQLRKTPLRNSNISGRTAIGLQVNRLPKKEITRKNAQNAFNSAIGGQDQFAQIKSDMVVIQEKMQTKGTIEIKDFSQLAEVRKEIFKNNDMFDYSVNSITKAQGGNFTFKQKEKSNEDEARLFAQWMVRRVIENAVKFRIVRTSSVQTDEVEKLLGDTNGPIEFKAEEPDRSLDKAPKALIQFIKNSRFVDLLDKDKKAEYSNRTQKPFDWMIHTIRSIYDEKTVDDRTNERDGQPIPLLPEYMLVWAFRQYGREDLIQKGCWDIFITSHYYMQRFLEITLFVRFLDENLTNEQLSFFLKCRTWILQRCISIPVEHKDLDLYFTETFLTKLQVNEFFDVTFPDTEKELIDELAVRGCTCIDPDRDEEGEAACIPMMRILELAVGELQDEKVRRLRQMIAFFRPVPRMTLKRFGVFVKSMISNIDPNMIDSLYRSGLVSNTVRVDMDQEAFAKYFSSTDPIVPRGFVGKSITCKDFAEFSTMYAMSLNRWTQFSPFLFRLLQTMENTPFEGSKNMINEIRHQIFQLLEAKVSFDGVLFYQSYHRVLQTVMRTCLKINSLDPLTFGNQVADFQVLLRAKFQAVQEAYETQNDE